MRDMCRTQWMLWRHAIVEVNVVIGVLVVHGELLVVRVVPFFLIVMLQFIAFILIAVYRSPLFSP